MTRIIRRGKAEMPRPFATSHGHCVESIAIEFALCFAQSQTVDLVISGNIAGAAQWTRPSTQTTCQLEKEFPGVRQKNLWVSLGSGSLPSE